MTYISPKPQTLPKCLSVSESLSENNSEDLTIKTSKEKKKIQHDLFNSCYLEAQADKVLLLPVRLLYLSQSWQQQIHNFVKLKKRQIYVYKSGLGK